MGHLFLPSSNRPIPPGTEIVERDSVRTARWRDGRGNLRTAAMRATPKGDVVVIPGTRSFARYKDGVGETRVVATGCKDESAARAMLVALERRAEMVRSGLLTPAEDAAADEKRVSVEKHLASYVQSLQAKGDTERHCKNVRRLVTTVFMACKFHALRDVKREAVEAWLTRGHKSGRSARTRNMYLAACKWFLNFCVDTERLIANPLARIPAADEHADRRRQPRALTESELVRLLDAARRRPLDEALRIARGWRRGQLLAKLRPETRVKLELLGRERALAYKTMALSGLRLGELAAVRVRDVVLDGPAPHILLAARHTKNREEAVIPLRADLAEDLRRWINGAAGDRLLFRLSANQVKTFDRDLRFAGIPKRDDRGRVAVVHSLRHSFATLLSRGGVAPRTAQAALRHSSIDLTMQVYCDPRLIDVTSALQVLPELPLDRAQLVATGTPQLSP